MEGDLDFEWPESGRRKVVTPDFSSSWWVALDDVEKYGLEYCLYFRSLQLLSCGFFLMSIPASFLMTWNLQGTRFAGDLANSVASTTLGNDTGQLRLLDTGGWAVLWLQMTPFLALLMLTYWLWPRLAQHPDLTSEPSAADYALEVFGLPDTATEQEIIQHFEDLLKDQESGLVCEVAICPDLRRRQVASEQQHRPVFSAFVVLASEAERNWLLRRYRVVQLPLLRIFQPKALRFAKRWPLVLRSAPEPCDLQWDKLRRCRGCASVACLVSFLFIIFSWVLASGLALLLWWLLLEDAGQVMTCACSVQSSWLSWSAVAGNAFLAELGFHVWARLGPRLLRGWGFRLSSSEEAIRSWMLALLQCTALPPLLGLHGLKIFWAYGVITSPVETSQLRVDQLDMSFYLYGVPVLVIWSAARWLGVIADALRSRVLRQSQRFILSRRYASLVAALAPTLIFQPLVPALPCLAALGLAGRYSLEKLIFLRGAAVRTGTPVRMALWGAQSVLHLHVALGLGCGLVTSAFWTGDLSSTPQLAIYCAILGLVVLLWPLLLWLLWCCCWLLGLGSPPGTWRPLVARQERMGFHEAWLIMRHRRILASYSVSDSSHGPPEVETQRSRVGRNIDMTCSRAVVQERAPTRAGHAQ